MAIEDVRKQVKTALVLIAQLKKLFPELLQLTEDDRTATPPSTSAASPARPCSPPTASPRPSPIPTRTSARRSPTPSTSTAAPARAANPSSRSDGLTGPEGGSGVATRLPPMPAGSPAAAPARPDALGIVRSHSVLPNPGRDRCPLPRARSPPVTPWHEPLRCSKSDLGPRRRSSLRNPEESWEPPPFEPSATEARTSTPEHRRPGARIDTEGPHVEIRDTNRWVPLVSPNRSPALMAELGGTGDQRVRLIESGLKR